MISSHEPRRVLTRYCVLRGGLFLLPLLLCAALNVHAQAGAAQAPTHVFYTSLGLGGTVAAPGDRNGRQKFSTGIVENIRGPLAFKGLFYTTLTEKPAFDGTSFGHTSGVRLGLLAGHELNKRVQVSLFEAVRLDLVRRPLGWHQEGSISYLFDVKHTRRIVLENENNELTEGGFEEEMRLVFPNKLSKRVSLAPTVEWHKEHSGSQMRLYLYIVYARR